MIKLTRAPKPQRLDDTTVSELTRKYAESKTPVWNVDFIKQPLLDSSGGKCAYCEASISEESKYMEVEHFRCKSDFPDKVVEWDNLLPSCKRCNGKKLDYNLDIEGSIINPFNTNPSDHLYLQNFRLHGRDDIGRRTIGVIYLNDSARLVSVRLRIGEAIATALDVIRDKLENYNSGPQTVRLRNQITSGMEKLLSEAQSSSEYSAVAATVLLTDPNYIWIKRELAAQGLWEPLEDLELAATAIAMFP